MGTGLAITHGMCLIKASFSYLDASHAKEWLYLGSKFNFGANLNTSSFLCRHRDFSVPKIIIINYQTKLEVEVPKLHL